MKLKSDFNNLKRNKMKKRSLFVYLMLVVFTTISINVWAGNEESFNSNYKISPDLNFSPTSDFQKSWEIAYGESKTPVHVFMKETKKGQEYLVRTKYFEVKYMNDSKGFGVKMVNGSESTVSESLNTAVLNQTSLNNQKCISSEAIGSDKVLEMIASYLPDLINEQYNSILN
jgi:translation elongation factor EF-G